jgi:hypothetical protein
VHPVARCSSEQSHHSSVLCPDPFRSLSGGEYASTTVAPSDVAPRDGLRSWSKRPRHAVSRPQGQERTTAMKHDPENTSLWRLVDASILATTRNAIDCPSRILHIRPTPVLRKGNASAHLAGVGLGPSFVHLQSVWRHVSMALLDLGRRQGQSVDCTFGEISPRSKRYATVRHGTIRCEPAWIRTPRSQM